jgi:hypothetical protein
LWNDEGTKVSFFVFASFATFCSFSFRYLLFHWPCVALVAARQADNHPIPARDLQCTNDPIRACHDDRPAL